MIARQRGREEGESKVGEERDGGREGEGGRVAREGGSAQ